MYNNFQLSQNLLNSLLQCPIDLFKSLNYLLFFTPDNSRLLQALYPNIFSAANSINEMAIAQHNSDTNIPLFFNYNPNISLNYGSVNTTFSNSNSNLSEFPLQTSQNVCNDFSLLNLKRNRDPNEVENIPKKKPYFYCTKSETIQNEEKVDSLNYEKAATSFNSSENLDIGELEKSISEDKKTKDENFTFSHKEEKNEVEDKKKFTGVNFGNKNKKMCKELLKDSLLEHIGEIKPQYLAPSFENGQLSIVIDNSSSNDVLNSIKQNGCTKKPKLKKKCNNSKIVKKSENTKKQNMNNQTTTVIFHDNNYKNTKNEEDFMKYNFNYYFPKSEAKKWIPYYKCRQVDLKKLNLNFPATHNENLENIKPKWLRSKFHGNNFQLNQAINSIQEIYKANRSTLDEEKCLNLLEEHKYNIEDLICSKCI